MSAIPDLDLRKIRKYADHVVPQDFQDQWSGPRKLVSSPRNPTRFAVWFRS